MEQKLKQMSLLGDSHANHLAQQEKEKEQKMTDTYFQKCLESLKRLKQGGLLERMCKAMNRGDDKRPRPVATPLMIETANHNLSEGEGDGAKFVAAVAEQLDTVSVA